MAVDAAQFRVDLPEFASTTVYPDSGVTFWLAIAYKLLRPEAWVDVLDFGAELFVAHNLAIEGLNQKAAAGGGAPGANVGAASQKTIDKVSVSYDTTAGLEPGAGHWNLTNYGTRFYRLMMLAGMGGRQITGFGGYPCPPTLY